MDLVKNTGSRFTTRLLDSLDFLIKRWGMRWLAPSLDDPGTSKVVIGCTSKPPIPPAGYNGVLESAWLGYSFVPNMMYPKMV